jgi:hypothetical protein
LGAKSNPGEAGTPSNTACTSIEKISFASAGCEGIHIRAIEKIQAALQSQKEENTQQQKRIRDDASRVGHFEQ